MSYTTLNRMGEPTHIYVPSKQASFVPGTWWPDFGPSSNDFCYQEKKHPTITVFRTQMQEPQDRRNAAARGEKLPTLPQPGEVRVGRTEDERPVQFRRNPSTEALYSSTAIRPYKSGGHMTGGKERHCYQFGAARTPPALENEAQAYAGLLSRSQSSPSVSPTLPTSLVRLRESQPVAPEAAGPASRTSAAVGQGASLATLPGWVAGSTVFSRPPGAAGHGGTTKNKHLRTGLATGGASETLPGGSKAQVDAAQASLSIRMQLWQDPNFNRVGGVAPRRG